MKAVSYALVLTITALLTACAPGESPDQTAFETAYASGDYGEVCLYDDTAGNPA